jgi:hypothetical protein
MAVNANTWKRFPIADRDQGFNADDAIKRIQQAAAGSVETFNMAFLWRDSQGPPNNKNSYRLPIADIINGRFALIPHAVFTAAAILQGAHGGLEGVVGDQEKAQLRDVVTQIYAKLQQTFGDERIVPPWDREDVPPQDRPNRQINTTASAEETEGEDEAVTASAPVKPPAEWFNDPQLEGPTPLTVTADGRVFGHMALWNVCHFGIMDTCRMAPRSQSQYKFFANGHVLTADGSQVRVGRITLGTGHANIRLGYIPAADHYDNTGTAVAVVAAGEDPHGLWLAGAAVPGTPEEKLQELRRSPISGDWRVTPQGLELVAALAVNNPGFPIMGFTAAGEVQTLVAAGMVLSEEEILSIGGHTEPVAPDPAVLERLQKYQDKAAKLTRAARSRRLDSVLKRMG